VPPVSSVALVAPDSVVAFMGSSVDGITGDVVGIVVGAGWVAGVVSGSVVGMVVGFVVGSMFFLRQPVIKDAARIRVKMKIEYRFIFFPPKSVVTQIVFP